jgi:hypothetical protein
VAGDDIGVVDWTGGSGSGVQVDFLRSCAEQTYMVSRSSQTQGFVSVLASSGTVILFGP